jgi:hypothetical protein
VVGFIVAQARIGAELRLSDPLRKRPDAVSDLVGGGRNILGLRANVPSGRQGNAPGESLGKTGRSAGLFGQYILSR